VVQAAGSVITQYPESLPTTLPAPACPSFTPNSEQRFTPNNSQKNNLKVKGELEPDFIMDAIYGGHYWGLSWRYSGIFHGHQDSRRSLSEVVDILDMWSLIESGYAALTAKDKARVEKEAEPFGKNPRFRGFDGNNESEHMGIANFLISKLERFSSFEGRDLNSHMPSLETYQRMLRVFEPMRRNLMGRELGVGEIIEILNEMTHPENRGTKLRSAKG
jgi:uncharacterized protein YfbU (UPF0304 family)